MKQQKRLKILSNSEIRDLYEKPQFTNEDRVEHFSLSPTEKLIIDDLRLLKSKVSFILKLGHFKAKNLFFTVNIDEVREDVDYITKTFFEGKNLLEPVSKFIDLPASINKLIPVYIYGRNLWQDL